jgi:hypothetical protein
MLFLGTALSGGHHGRDFYATILSRESEWFHDDLFTQNIERSRNNGVDEPLNVLSIVWSHAVHHCTLDFTVNKITPINLPSLVRVAIVHQVQVIVPDFTRISRLADEVLTE